MKCMKAVSVLNFKIEERSNQYSVTISIFKPKLRIQNQITENMSKKTKALVYNFIGFAFFYVVIYFLLNQFTYMTGILVPLTAAVAASIITPKFQAVRYQGEEKLFMKWLFMKGIKEVR